MLKSNLSVLMAERGLKIAKIYEDTGISKTTLMALAENTGKGVQFDTVDKLCNYLGVTPTEFFVYVPIIWDMSVGKRKNNPKDYIVINVKNSKLRKSYKLTVYFCSPENFDFPIHNEKFDLWMNVDLEQSDAYDEEDFFKMIESFPITYENDFRNEIFELSQDILTSYLKKHDDIHVLAEHGKSFKYKPFSVNDRVKVALHIFGDNAKHEAMSTIIFDDIFSN